MSAELAPELLAKLRTFGGGRTQTVRDSWDAPEVDALLRAGLLEIKQIAKASMTFGLSEQGERYLAELEQRAG